ncbi:hypothetical protein QEL93_001942 [Pseudomonas putida]|nr:hypothetical protein [Pseudomonas putida]
MLSSRSTGWVGHQSDALHAGTPAVSGTFRTLSLLRTPQAARAPARVLVSRTVIHPFSRTTRLFGARALNNTVTGNADAITVSGLAGQPLCLHTADGDAAFTLPDVAGRPLWARNAQGTVSTAAYEAANAGGRPLSLSETALGAPAGRVREQYAYAPLAEAKWQALNLAGSQVELRNNAGISRPLSVSLTGQPLAAEQRLLKVEIETPDWSTTTADDTEAPLSIAGTYDATGAPLAMTNAAGITSLTDYAINGAVTQTRLVYREQGSTKETVTLTAIQYRADGLVLSQTAGNGVIDRYEYDAKTQRLSRHLTERPKGHPQGPLVISDLHYRYDPVGNITRLEDQGADPTWHANQQATGLREYTYDTLYRLASATGRERTPVARYHGAEASSGSVWAPYSEHYTYDDGNNLTTIRHVSVAGNRTRELQVSEGSNRAMVKGHNLTPETGFLAGGLQKQLADGRALQWLADNQLGKVTAVSRGDGDDDSERYHYADGGTRTRKVHKAQVSAATQTTITTYAGGCEVRQRWLVGQETPQKHIVITEAGGVRVVENRLTGTVHLRYRFTDHLTSVGGETDESGTLISREEYAPYGGTVGRDEAAEEVSNLTQRTMRYSNKEQDATGLYYYGWRYYQPEQGRWLSADPGGLVDSINLFRMCRNNPLSFIDEQGFEPVYPPLAVFVNDVMAGLTEMDKGYVPYSESGHLKRPVAIAIWAGRIYVSEADRHISIRPEQEKGFPDFVGVLDDDVVTNETGHYRTPESHKDAIPEGFRYTNKFNVPEGVPRMTMFLSPDAYVDKVRELRGISDITERAQKVLEFLTKHHRRQDIDNLADAKHSVILDLLKNAGEEVELNIDERLSQLRAAYSRAGSERDKEIDELEELRAYYGEAIGKKGISQARGLTLEMRKAQRDARPKRIAAEGNRAEVATSVPARRNGFKSLLRSCIGG